LFSITRIVPTLAFNAPIPFSYLRNLHHGELVPNPEQ
jgi:hypothetical protein